MILNPNAKIPPIEVLYASCAGIVNEISVSRSRKAKRKLKAIYSQLSFIIQSV